MWVCEYSDGFVAKVKVPKDDGIAESKGQVKKSLKTIIKTEKNYVNAYKRSIQTHTHTRARQATIFGIYTDFFHFPFIYPALTSTFYQFNNQFMPTHNLNRI